MVGKKQARQFHQKLYSINQKSSDLKKWEALEQTSKLGTAYKWDYWVITVHWGAYFSYPYKTEVFKFVKHRVEKYIFKYEPLYVARAETPQFDERFIGFGMTRNTQVPAVSENTMWWY